jgi:hypothetical protein
MYPDLHKMHHRHLILYIRTVYPDGYQQLTPIISATASPFFFVLAMHTTLWTTAIGLDETVVLIANVNVTWSVGRLAYRVTRFEDESGGRGDDHSIFRTRGRSMGLGGPSIGAYICWTARSLRWSAILRGFWRLKGWKGGYDSTPWGWLLVRIIIWPRSLSRDLRFFVVRRRKRVGWVLWEQLFVGIGAVTTAVINIFRWRLPLPLAVQLGRRL